MAIGSQDLHILDIYYPLAHIGQKFCRKNGALNVTDSPLGPTMMASGV